MFAPLFIVILQYASGGGGKERKTWKFHFCEEKKKSFFLSSKYSNFAFIPPRAYLYLLWAFFPSIPSCFPSISTNLKCRGDFFQVYDIFTCENIFRLSKTRVFAAEVFGKVQKLGGILFLRCFSCLSQP